MVQDAFNVLFLCQYSFYVDQGNLYESWCVGYGSDETDDQSRQQRRKGEWSDKEVKT